MRHFLVFTFLASVAGTASLAWFSFALPVAKAVVCQGGCDMGEVCDTRTGNCLISRPCPSCGSDSTCNELTGLCESVSLLQPEPAATPRPASAAPSTSTPPRTLTNPLNETDLTKIIGRVVNAALGFSGALALLMFVWGGIQMMTAAGSPDRVKKGKQTLIWASIGLVVIFTSYVIVRAIITTLTIGVI